MTVVVGMRLHDGAVLASDSQITHGSLRKNETKLFHHPAGMIWGSAGDYGATQDLYGRMGAIDLGAASNAFEVKEAIRKAVNEAAQAQSSDSPVHLDGLFAWFGTSRVHLVRCGAGGVCEFASEYSAIGSAGRFAEFAVFGFSRSEFLDYSTLPLEIGKALALLTADDVIQAAATGLARPVQVAVVDADGAQVLAEDDIRPIRDTASAFRDNQRDFIRRRVPEGPAGPDTGVRP